MSYSPMLGWNGGASAGRPPILTPSYATLYPVVMQTPNPHANGDYELGSYHGSFAKSGIEYRITNDDALSMARAQFKIYFTYHGVARMRMSVSCFLVDEFDNQGQPLRSGKAQIQTSSKFGGSLVRNFAYATLNGGWTTPTSYDFDIPYYRFSLNVTCYVVSYSSPMYKIGDWVQIEFIEL